MKESAGQKAEEVKKAPSVAERAKEATVGTAKKVGSYTGEKAVEVKGRAVVAGWGAAEYTSEMTVEATKKTVDVAKGVAGYAGEKAVAAKDVVAHGVQKAAQYTGEKVGVVKDKVVAAEESVKEYAARKKAEAERELEARSAAQSKVIETSMVSPLLSYKNFFHSSTPSTSIAFIVAPSTSIPGSATAFQIPHILHMRKLHALVRPFYRLKEITK